MNFPKDLRECLSTFLQGTTGEDILRESIRRALGATGRGRVDTYMGNNELMMEWEVRKVETWGDQTSLRTLGSYGLYGMMTMYLEDDTTVDEVLDAMEITEAGWELLRRPATAAYIDGCETIVDDSSTLELAPTEMWPWLFDPATIIDHQFTV